MLLTNQPVIKIVLCCTVIEIKTESLIPVKPINNLRKEKEKLEHPKKYVRCSMTPVNLLTQSIHTEANYKDEQFIKSIERSLATENKLLKRTSGQ